MVHPVQRTFQIIMWKDYFLYSDSHHLIKEVTVCPQIYCTMGSAYMANSFPEYIFKRYLDVLIKTEVGRKK